MAPYRRLRRDADVRRHGFLAEGMVVLEKAVAMGRYPLTSVLVSDRMLPRAAAVLERAAGDLALYVAAQEVLDAVCGLPLHRGVLAYGAGPRLPSPAEFLSGMDEAAVVVCAVGIGDPENLGAIFRNAAALGAAGVLLDTGCCDAFYRRAIRVSVGAALTLPCSRLEPEDDLIEVLVAGDFVPLALSPGGDIELKALRRPARAALLLGAEGPGLPPELLARTRTVRIAMAGGFDSLNVAAASAIALHHLLSS